MRRRRAVIIGGSLGGLFAAHELRAIDWDVDVFERTADDLADRGAGIGTHRPLFEIMRRAGLRLDPEADGTTPRSYICLDRDNRLIHELTMHRTMTAWSRCTARSRTACPKPATIRPSPWSASRRTTRVQVFTDGSRAAGDLVIGADGFRSTVRAQILPT